MKITRFERTGLALLDLELDNAAVNPPDSLLQSLSNPCNPRNPCQE